MQGKTTISRLKAMAVCSVKTTNSRLNQQAADCLVTMPPNLEDCSARLLHLQRLLPPVDSPSARTTQHSLLREPLEVFLAVPLPLPLAVDCSVSKRNNPLNKREAASSATLLVAVFSDPSLLLLQAEGCLAQLLLNPPQTPEGCLGTAPTTPAASLATRILLKISRINPSLADCSATLPQEQACLGDRTINNPLNKPRACLATSVNRPTLAADCSGRPINNPLSRMAVFLAEASASRQINNRRVV